MLDVARVRKVFSLKKMPCARVQAVVPVDGGGTYEQHRRCNGCVVGQGRAGMKEAAAASIRAEPTILQNQKQEVRKPTVFVWTYSTVPTTGKHDCTEVLP
jgi:hypothetical protein